jgi:hypothetical protein
MRNRYKLLEETGNSLEDALYASPLLDPMLYTLYSEFILGRLSIAIYDKRFLTQHDFEYYTFSRNFDRTQALVGIIRSPVGNERLMSIDKPILKREWYGFGAQ